jgi:hypothetical protein
MLPIHITWTHILRSTLIVAFYAADSVDVTKRSSLRTRKPEAVARRKGQRRKRKKAGDLLCDGSDRERPNPRASPKPKAKASASAKAKAKGKTKGGQPKAAVKAKAKAKSGSSSSGGLPNKRQKQ